MREFYRGPRARITQHTFETEHVGYLQYAIKDLSNVRIVRYDPERFPGSRIMGLSALAAALIIVPVVGPISRVLTGLAVAGFLVGAVVNLRRPPTARWKLVATYVGQEVALFVSEDETEFRQVCRGLQRAFEYRRDRAFKD
jgi:hypothetical protein